MIRPRPEGEPTPEEIYRHAAKLRRSWDRKRLAEQEGRDRPVMTVQVEIVVAVGETPAGR